MATDRSRRLRKKLCIDEFQKLGFELNFHCKEGVNADTVSAFMLRLTDQATEANELTYGGCNELGFVCPVRRGSVNEEQRALIEAWLKQQPKLASVGVGTLVDAWCPEQPVLPKL